MQPIYLDNQATTPVDPRVLERMLPYFGPKFGNAASRSHAFGIEAEQAVEFARKRIAALAGASPAEIVFTSGATESNNLAIKGMARAGSVITVATEHRAVLDPVKSLESIGRQIIVLPVGPDGRLDTEVLRAAIRSDTALVSVMYANNETGVIQPVREIGAICRKRNVIFHCDAAQAFGKIPLHVDADHVDLMSLSAHKIYGPKGVGALYVRRRGPRLTPQMDGGGHEGGLRSGTLNVPGIVGFGEACAICATEMESETARLTELRDRLEARLVAEGATVNGSREHRLPGSLNLRIEGVLAASLLTSLPEVALSTGSACSSAVPQPSHVLQALGLSREKVLSSVRFGLGRFNTAEDLKLAAGQIVEAVRKLRALTPA